MPVHLPLEKFEKCFKCDKKDNLRLCSRCGEATYCSQECQKTDWNAHSKQCGKNEAIDLSKFYPVLACLAELSHIFPEKPMHPALRHQVINDANPGVNPYALPDGLSPAKLLILGDECNFHEQGVNSTHWMPQAKTLKILAKLARRVMREGYALQIAMSICLALVHAVYTTTYTKDATDVGSKKRVRIRYGSLPIADFGICVGSADVKNQDKLAYWLPDGDILTGQDPKEHYWIYFTTISGEEITLDLAMFTFNMCLMVQTPGYLPSQMAMALPFAPVFYRDRKIRKNTPELYRERGRLSILRNRTVKNLFDDPKYMGEHTFTEPALNNLVALAEQFAGHKFNIAEVQMIKLSTERHCAFLNNDITNERWKRYPEEASIAIEQDPGECDNLDDKSTAWAKTMRKWKREHRRTKRTAEK